VAEVTTREALGDTQRFGVRMTERVEPCPVVEAAGIDDQRVTLPVADRIPKPRGVLEDVLASVEIDHALRVDAFIQDDQQVRQVNESPWERQQIAHRHSGGEAVRGGVVLAQALRALQEHRQHLLFDRNVLILVVGKDVQKVLREDAWIITGNGEIADPRKQAIDLTWR